MTVASYFLPVFSEWRPLSETRPSLSKAVITAAVSGFFFAAQNVAIAFAFRRKYIAVAVESDSNRSIDVLWRHSGNRPLSDKLKFRICAVLKSQQDGECEESAKLGHSS